MMYKSGYLVHKDIICLCVIVFMSVIPIENTFLHILHILFAFVPVSTSLWIS